MIKVAKIREREAKRVVPGLPSTTELFVEVTAIFQVDCMVSGIAPYGKKGDMLVLAYTTEEDYDDEAAGDRDAQRRKSANRPELRIISRDGEELSSDAISLRNYSRFQCRDYSLTPTSTGDGFLVVSPEDIVVARTRDETDHVSWLIAMQRYDEALKALDKLDASAGSGFDAADIGKRYLDFLVAAGELDGRPLFRPLQTDDFSLQTITKRRRASARGYWASTPSHGKTGSSSLLRRADSM